MTYREAISIGESILQKANIVDAKNDAWLLLAMACKIDHTYYSVHMDEEMSQEQIREYQALLSKRAERIPLQYIVGEQEFMGLKFRVNSNVLIPRQDTETLVEEALKVIEPGMRVLDMCTGSGCIIISILKNTTNVDGAACDISRSQRCGKSACNSSQPVLSVRGKKVLRELQLDKSAFYRVIYAAAEDKRHGEPAPQQGIDGFDERIHRHDRLSVNL